MALFTPSDGRYRLTLKEIIANANAQGEQALKELHFYLEEIFIELYKNYFFLNEQQQLHGKLCLPGVYSGFLLWYIQEADDEIDNTVRHFRRFETSSDDDLSCASSDSEPVEVEDSSGDQSAKLLMPPRQRPLIRVRRLNPKSKWRRILWGGVYAFVFGSGK